MSYSTFKPERYKDLHGKTVVITGASSGAGKAAALEFARHGANLVIAARRMDALEQVLSECHQIGGRAVAIHVDVTDSDSLKTLATAASSYTGMIDVWVNNAGVMAAGEFDRMPAEVQDQVVKTNLLGYMHGAHAVLPYFKKQGYGVLINNISVGAWFPTPYAVAYTASKYGLRGFSEALRGELVHWPGIRVCDLYTAFLDTPGMQHAANYTGVALKPAPPVMDPQKLARKIVNLARFPAKTKETDALATMLRLSQVFVPHLTRRITNHVIRTYFANANPIPNTKGNLFEPVEFGTSIHGGWARKTGQDKIIKNSLLVTGLAAGLFILNRIARSK